MSNRSMYLGLHTICIKVGSQLRSNPKQSYFWLKRIWRCQNQIDNQQASPRI